MSKSPENVFEKIDQMYYELTASEKKAADYVLAHRSETQFMSIAELADESGVAEATVSRFCRRLGYGGYNVFKLAIANASASQQGEFATVSGQARESDSFADLCAKLFSADRDAMAQTLSLLRQERVREAVDLLAAAEKVICMGQGSSMLMAEEAANLFSLVSGKFFAVQDSHSQIMAVSNAGAHDLLLFFSYSGATRDMMDTLRMAREQGTPVILVTRFARSPGAALAKLVLPVGSNESPLQLGSVSAKIAQLFLLDVLFSEYCRRDVDGCMARRERIAAALAGKHL